MALGQICLRGAAMSALAALLSSGLGGVAVFALRLIGSFAAFTSATEYALTKIAHLCQCLVKLGLQLSSLLCALLELLLVAVNLLLSRLFELAAQLGFVLGHVCEQLALLQFKPFFSDHSALVC